MTPQAAPINPRATSRRSSDSVWPLRDAQGRTWAERARTGSSARASAGDNPAGDES